MTYKNNLLEYLYKKLNKSKQELDECFTFTFVDETNSADKIYDLVCYIGNNKTFLSRQVKKYKFVYWFNCYNTAEKFIECIYLIFLFRRMISIDWADINVAFSTKNNKFQKIYLTNSLNQIPIKIKTNLLICLPSTDYFKAVNRIDEISELDIEVNDIIVVDSSFKLQNTEERFFYMLKS